QRSDTHITRQGTQTLTDAVVDDVVAEIPRGLLEAVADMPKPKQEAQVPEPMRQEAVVVVVASGEPEGVLRDDTNPLPKAGQKHVRFDDNQVVVPLPTPY